MPTPCMQSQAPYQASPSAHRLSLRPCTARPQNCSKQTQSERYPVTCSAAGNGSAAAKEALQVSLAGQAVREEDRLPPWALTFDLRERETGVPSLNKTDMLCESLPQNSGLVCEAG